jgi:hypothetical protein
MREVELKRMIRSRGMIGPLLYDMRSIEDELRFASSTSFVVGA